MVSRMPFGHRWRARQTAIGLDRSLFDQAADFGLTGDGKLDREPSRQIGRLVPGQLVAIFQERNGLADGLLNVFLVELGRGSLGRTYGPARLAAGCSRCGLALGPGRWRSPTEDAVAPPDPAAA